MRLFKRVGGTIIVLLVIVSIVASAFAAGAEAILPAEIFGTLYSSYLAARGIGVVMSENNVASSFGNTIAADPAADMWLDIYARANGKFPSAEQMSIQDWVTFAEANVSTNIGPAGNVTPTYTTFQLSSALVEWFDKVTTDLLSIDLGVASESGVYHSSGNFFDSTIASYVPVDNAELPVCQNNLASVQSDGLYCAQVNNSLYWIAASSVGSVFAGAYVQNGRLFVVCKSISPFTAYYCSSAWNAGFYSASSSFDSSRNQYISAPIINVSYSTVTQLNIPLYSSADEFFGAEIEDSDSSYYKIQLRPEDKYNEGLTDGTGRVLPKGDVYIPDATTAGYQADTLTGTWNLPWNDAFSDSLRDILAGVRELVLANDTVLEEEAVAPSPFEAPLLPPADVGDLPSFEFNLSGIWHYVVDWVASLSNGFSLISSAWSALPYAMVLPIYASAVVVIVLGMWKRFFS